MTNDWQVNGEIFYNVAVYGTLKATKHNHHLLSNGNAQFLGTAISVNPIFDMVEISRAYPAVYKGTKKLQVEIYQVDSKCLADLDMLEGYPHYYNRLTIPYQLDNGEIINALTYVMSSNMISNIENNIMSVSSESENINLINNILSWG